MNTTTTWIAKTTLILATITMFGCGQGFKSNSGGSGDSAASLNANPNVPQVDMQHVRASVNSAQSALANAQSALSQIFDSNGHFNFSALIGGVNFGDLKSCVSGNFTGQNLIFLPQDIANALGCVLNDVQTVAGAAKADLDDATATLNAALLMVPAGSPEALEIQSMLSEIQTMQATYLSTVHSLASQVSLATTFLSTLPGLASTICPIPLVCGLAVNVLLQPIQQTIATFQANMASL